MEMMERMIVVDFGDEILLFTSSPILVFGHRMIPQWGLSKLS
jgi:hypothetical protein